MSVGECDRKSVWSVFASECVRAIVIARMFLRTFCVVIFVRVYVPACMVGVYARKL